MPDLTRLRGDTIMTAGPGGQKNPLFTKEEREKSRKRAQRSSKSQTDDNNPTSILETPEKRRQFRERVEAIRGMSKAEQRKKLQEAGIHNPEEVLKFGPENVANILELAEMVDDPNILAPLFRFITKQMPEKERPQPRFYMGGIRG